MTLNATEREQALQDAFLLFNQASEQLAGSYQQLQQQVVQLSNELSSVRSERVRQLMEKERVADRLARLLEALPAAVVVLDGQDQVIEFNQAAEQLLGTPLNGEAWDSIWSGIRERVLRDAANDTQIPLPEDGRLLSITERKLEQEPGRILVLLDVTETRQLQERLNHQKRLTAMGEMAAQLAHQIRTPLSSALLYTSHLARTDIDAGQRLRFSDRLRSRLQYVERQINDMLAFARNGISSVEHIAISTLLQEFIRNNEPQLESANASVVFNDLTNSTSTIMGNRDGLLGAFTNLLNNALDHGADLIEINLSYTQSSSQSVMIRLRDNGAGIPEDIRGRIFEPFFTTRSDGTGLGLAVVQNVVLNHHGYIELEPSSGTGTCFRLLLPVENKSQQAHQAVAEQNQMRKIL